MKNKTGWIILLIVTILVAGYVYKSQISNMFMKTSTLTSYNTSSTTSDLITTKTDPLKGDYLVGMNNMTLYTFDEDQPNTNNCSGTCASVWPAYTTVVAPATALPDNLTIFTGPDSIMQYAYYDKPLYYYSLDKQAGDVLGDGVGGMWHLVKP